MPGAAVGPALAEAPPQLVELLAQFLVVGAKRLDDVPHRLEGESFSAVSGSCSVSMNTGMTMVPTVLSWARRIARPTAWTMSTSDRVGR